MLYSNPENALETMIAAFEKQPVADLVCSDGWRVNERGEILRPLFPEGSAAACGRIGTAGEMFAFFPYVLPSGMMFTLELYERAGPFQGMVEDWHWVIRAVRQHAFCARVESKLVIYRQHQSSMTAQGSRPLEEVLWVYEELWGNRQADGDAARWARKMVRRRAAALLANCPSEPSREMLRQARKIVGRDWLLDSA